MSTTTTLQVFVDRVKDPLTLVVKPNAIQIAGLPPQLHETWEHRYRKRNPRPLSEEDLEKALSSIVLSTTLRGLDNVRGLEIMSSLSLTLPATDKYPEDLIWKGHVVSISTKVTF